MSILNATDRFSRALNTQQPEYAMSENYIISEQNEGVLTITLNRPENLNSFNKAMALHLQDVLNWAEDDKEIRAIILTGAGKGFCAGQDLAEAVEVGKDPEAELGDIVRNSYNPIIRAIRTIGVPVIAAVNGTAAGAGANLAFACDLILASEHAKFIQAFSKIGLIPDSGGTYFLPRMVGMHRAAARMMLADSLPAEEAKKLGIVLEIYSANKLMSEAEILANRLASQPTQSFKLIKQAINHSFDNTLEEQLELEADLQTQAGKTEDYTEGVNAFMEKRIPEFRGR